MFYSASDIFQRIKRTLPGRWFGENTPILDAVLLSLSTGWVGLFSLLNYAAAQTRISTASGDWLDLIAADYFRYRIRRRLRESDASYRIRIHDELIRDRCTRASIYDLLLELTGRAPYIFEPTNPGDTGSYGSLMSPGIGTAGYTTSGGWGSLNLPFQVFVRAFQPITAGVAIVNGWCGTIGAFGSGQSAYFDLTASSPTASRLELYQSVCRTAPTGTIVWISMEP
jgi:hypothetical protein